MGDPLSNQGPGSPIQQPAVSAPALPPPAGASTGERLWGVCCVCSKVSAPARHGTKQTANMVGQHVR